jgi:5,10-methenyltetrahydromethanopterin hydrogenase
MDYTKSFPEDSPIKWVEAGDDHVLSIVTESIFDPVTNQSSEQVTAFVVELHKDANDTISGERIPENQVRYFSYDEDDRMIVATISSTIYWFKKSTENTRPLNKLIASPVFSAFVQLACPLPRLLWILRDEHHPELNELTSYIRKKDSSK